RLAASRKSSAVVTPALPGSLIFPSHAAARPLLNPQGGKGPRAMGLRRMWSKVRSLSERPHNLLAISDLHLGCDLRNGMKKEVWGRPRPADGPLASFLDWHATHRLGNKPWRLILNGDIVDFISITTTPSP